MARATIAGAPDNRPQREFRNYRDMNPQREPQPVVDIPAPTLPSFITAAPRVPSPAESLDAPQPVVDAPVEAPELVEVAPTAAAEEPSAEPRLAAPRGRRRRLRSPYGFHAGGDEAPVTPGDGSSSD